MRKLLISICILSLLGCATGYKKYGLTGGYKEMLIGEKQYELTYQGNATTSHTTVEQYWHRRAKELCNNGEYDFKFTDTKAQVGYTQYGTFEHPKVIGTVTCK